MSVHHSSSHASETWQKASKKVRKKTHTYSVVLIHTYIYVLRQALTDSEERRDAAERKAAAADQAMANALMRLHSDRDLRA